MSLLSRGDLFHSPLGNYFYNASLRAILFSDTRGIAPSTYFGSGCATAANSVTFDFPINLGS